MEKCFAPLLVNYRLLHEFFPQNLMRWYIRPINLTLFILGCLGFHPAADAAQLFEFEFDVTGYEDVTDSRFLDEGENPGPQGPTDASVNIKILGTDDNADGELEVREYTAIWTDSFGTVEHFLDDALLRGFSTLRFDRSSLNLTSLDLESHPVANDPNEVIFLGGSSPSLSSELSSFSSFLETSAPGFGVARSCGGFEGTGPCDVTLTARAVPEYLSPFASIFVLVGGLWMKKRFTGCRYYVTEDSVEEE